MKAKKMPNDTKKCPFCAETIKAEAIVCRFCRRGLVENNSSNIKNVLWVEAKGQKQKSSLYLLATILILAIAFVIFFLLTFRQSNTQAPPLTANVTQTSSAYITPTLRSYILPTPLYAINFVRILDKEIVCTRDTIGNVIVVGKIMNTSSVYNLQFVKLRATLFTSTGEVINTNTGFVDSDVLFANTTSTYKIYVNAPANNEGECRVAVEDASFK